MIVLDTHVWLWLRSEPERVPQAVRRRAEADGAALATVSCWEVATLARLGRISLDRDVSVWVDQALAERPSIEAIALDPAVAVAAGQLDDRFPGDPADRIILATARLLRCSLATGDRRLRSYAPDETIWD